MQSANSLFTQTVQVVEIYDTPYSDEIEGKVKLLLKNGKKLSACYWGENFIINTQTQVLFFALDYPITWEAIFSENKEKKLGLDPAEEDCSYYAYGKIISINPVIADFGDLVLEIGNWTHDERVIGEFIYWKIDRLDVTQKSDENF